MNDILNNKRILLGVSGGIAAYKSPNLVRRFRDRGCDVQVVMTQGAQQFVTPLTFQAVSGHPVRGELFDPDAEAAFLTSAVLGLFVMLRANARAAVLQRAAKAAMGHVEKSITIG